MAKIKNKRVHSEDREYLQRLADELEWIGRSYKLDLKEGVLIQYAIPPHKRRKTKSEKDKEARNKRAESAARRS
jgi:glutamate mutase epsilon subunit